MRRERDDLERRREREREKWIIERERQLREEDGERQV